MNTAGRMFQAFCIVGLGNHARTKLLPAISANGQVVDAIVSRQGKGIVGGPRVFTTIEQALAELPQTTTFFLSTPPDAHFDQAKVIVSRGFDLFIEKPAFVSRREALEICAICEVKGSLLIEGLMYRHTRLYDELLDTWSKSRGMVTRIAINFLIDRLPTGTFRSDERISSSALFDIGCYPVSLLLDMGLGDGVLRVTEVHHPRQPEKTQMRIAGRSESVDIDIRIGMGTKYENEVQMHMRDGHLLCFSPFFYGREAPRSVIASMGGETGNRKFVDADAFRIMLSIPREAWRQGQSRRLERMVATTSRLEDLANSIRKIWG